MLLKRVMILILESDGMYIIDYNFVDIAVETYKLSNMIN
jgi:hypothetical protein